MRRWSVLLVLLVLLLALATGTANGRTCTFEGFYDASAATLEPCPGVLPCPPGFFCTGGAKRPCPAGTYGADSQLRTRACTAICPAGFFCPEGSSAPLPCGSADRYCPLGSSASQFVPPGFYSLGSSSLQRDRIAPCPIGTFCIQGTRRPCPAGTYGATTALATPQCTQLCPAGSYCPEQSAAPVPCPAGTFGDRIGLTDASCAGRCHQGFYCPRGSISATAHACGFGAYCPPGSSSPTQAATDTYIVNGNSAHASTQLMCPIGSFCRGDGTAELCPGGTFGNATTLATSKCAGQCADGYYCPRGSTSATQIACGGADVFCPRGSTAPKRVRDGFYTVGAFSQPGRDQLDEDAANRSGQRRCEPGHYCALGARAPCAAGSFGNASGLTTSVCSGDCQPGFYCPERSISGTALQCGASDRFCPAGSSLPVRASRGHCTIGGGSSLTRTAQRTAQPGEFAWRGTCYPCPGGTFGAEALETNPQCSGVCARGYYCPPGSTSAVAHECGSAETYCPEGVAAPLQVQRGYYTTTQDSELCPPGTYRDVSTTTINSFVDVVTGRSPISVSYGDYSFPLAKCVLCPLGTFKPTVGDDLTLCQPCPEFTTMSARDRRSCECFRRAGGFPLDDAKTLELRFNAATLVCEQARIETVRSDSIAADASVFAKAAQFPCERGYYCVAGVRRPCPGGRFGNREYETRTQCTGACSPGFYCPLASTNSTARVCGNANVFCPEGSAVPTPVWVGYYSIRSALPLLAPSTPGAHALAYTALTASANDAIRDAQMQCEPGFFCVGGRKFACPSGRYGDQRGETSPLCAGSCQRGFYCPPGSVSATERACGGDDRVCRSGASLPAPVSRGYYSVGDTNATRFTELPCELGYFCIGGVKYQCPEGYACPSYPSAPSVRATQRECGDATVYCPIGTGNAPVMVSSGFYTVGAGDGTGDARNTTRTGQRTCPRGSYCRQGIVIPCPDGTYGDAEGLSDAYCRGWCPPGFACPRGTADYRANACPLGTYATKGSSRCIECPSKTDAHTRDVLALFQLRTDVQEQQPCTDKRECCFFG